MFALATLSLSVFHCNSEKTRDQSGFWDIKIFGKKNKYQKQNQQLGGDKT